MKFILQSPYKPAGDQPQAIEKLVAGLRANLQHQTLLGVTGSGKTYTIANVIDQVQRPTLVIAPNKTLAAQLTSEFRTFFPNNVVEYFVSYYDYYQPEAYLPGSDTYIEKEADINDEIDRLRHAATAALLSRRDVIVVASVSCIYGLGSPEEYQAEHRDIKVGQTIDREALIRDLVSMHYERTEILARGRFRVHGNTIEYMPAGKEAIFRIELAGDTVHHLIEYSSVTRDEVAQPAILQIYPAKHFVVSEERMKSALSAIETELNERLAVLEKEGKLLEVERLERRTRYDLELLRELGYCNGIENYSRHLTGRAAGEAPSTLIDFFPKDFLMVIDESHVTIPQIGGMYEGDRSRKQALVDFGFRLPSAIDNRPLKFPEFESKVQQAIYVSATPSRYELTKSQESAASTQNTENTTYSGIAEQIVRPTGLIDPEIIIRPAVGQVTNLLDEIEQVVKSGERVLVTTLTKKQAEQLTEYLKEREISAGYLHSEVETLDRMNVLNQLRAGDIEVLVGVNLLREGLDLPEVALVAILDADKEGFLRSETSLIQTMGRAARNIRGRVILYADRTTDSMQRAINEAERRRKIQVAYNTEHHITPQSVTKALQTVIDHELRPLKPTKEFTELIDVSEIPKMIRAKEREMKELATNLKFEEAALIRDEVIELKRLIRNR